MALNLVDVRLVLRLGSERMLRAGNWLAAVGGVAVAADTWTGWGGLAGLVVPMFLFVSATGLISANAVAGALADHPGQAGSVPPCSARSSMAPAFWSPRWSACLPTARRGRWGSSL